MPEIPSKISNETITSEADMICRHLADRIASNGPCQACRQHVTTMLTVASQMYEDAWDPEDARHQGFADGWLQGWEYAYRAGYGQGRDDEAAGADLPNWTEED